ncbi:MAG: MBL fold metallo-hydrolase [Pirellulaceae bacterium]|jgi:glyoxylase-like metal-dependent hydrolase (beta-lactamase superfamily II)|nr:MBL fold metallo-hydrolase [Pirellulaceae bacterium]
MPDQLTLHTIVSRGFSQNAYVASRAGRTDCVIVDPGFDSQAIQQCLATHHLTPRAILNTHGHIDHIAGNEALKRCWPTCPLVIGREDAYKLTDAHANLSAQYGIGLTSPPADELVDDGGTYTAAGFTFDVLAIPGHSRGHVVYLWNEDDPWVLFGGDILFEGSIGRFDFPDGDGRQLLTAIRTKLLVLPDDTVVLPGHGGATTIGRERRHNPYLRE